MKNVYLSGDPTYPLYHPFQNVDSLLESLFADWAKLTVSEHFEALEAWDYSKYDLVVYYTDHWIDKTKTSHQQVQALVHYIATGGALLILHNLDIGVDRELAQIVGARLLHPLAEQGGLRSIRFDVETGHPITAGVESFQCMDERFPLEYSPFTERVPLLTGCCEDGSRFPAGWLVSFGMGRVVYFSPGHEAGAFKIPAYQKLIRQTAQWLAHVCQGGKV